MRLCMSLKYKNATIDGGLSAAVCQISWLHGCTRQAGAAFCRQGLQSQFQKMLNILGPEPIPTRWPMHYKRGSGRPDNCVGRLIDSLSVRGLL